MIDIQTSHNGFAIALSPISSCGREWCARNIEEPAPWQAYGNGILCEPDMAVDIMRAMLADGLILQDESSGRIAGA